MKSAVIIDYGAGNIGSISNFLRNFDFWVEVSNDQKKIADSDLLVLPGVGSFGPAKSKLDTSGASDAIIKRVDIGGPTLGICLGFQLMTRFSEEAEDVEGLGLIDATTKRLTGGPVIGWQYTTTNSILPEQSNAYYFNHAYGVFGSPELEEVSFSNESLNIAYARTGNLIGTQFHPEKSQQAGFDFFSDIVNPFWKEIS